MIPVAVILGLKSQGVDSWSDLKIHRKINDLARQLKRGKKTALFGLGKKLSKAERELFGHKIHVLRNILLERGVLHKRKEDMGALALYNPKGKLVVAPHVAIKAKLKAYDRLMKKYRQCKKGSGKKVSKKCKDQRKDARKKLNDAVKIYHDRRKALQKAGKWKGAEKSFYVNLITPYLKHDQVTTVTDATGAAVHPPPETATKVHPPVATVSKTTTATPSVPAAAGAISAGAAPFVPSTPADVAEVAAEETTTTEPEEKEGPNMLLVLGGLTLAGGALWWVTRRRRVAA